MSEEKQPSVIVKNLTKSFRIPLEAHSGIKQKLINTLKGRKGYRDFTPLKDVSFTIEKGDFFGIVGRNGSGKSTLLKTIAGIYTPNKGEVHVDGKLVPFIELGVGFNPELTGRENVFLNGALLGFSRNEVEEMYDDIVEFAELNDFMEERLKNYSSGMQVRLAFSIAIRAEGDILLLDEVLAVGDEAFQRKCFDYFGSLKKDKKTVILVTHDMGSVERFCNKAMLIEKGSVVKYGKSAEVARMYQDLLIQDEKPKAVEVESRKTRDSTQSSNFDSVKEKYSISDIKFDLLDGEGVTTKINLHSPVTIRVTIDVFGSTLKGICAINVINSQGNIVLGMGVGKSFEPKLVLYKGKNYIDFSFDNILTDDSYSLNTIVGVYNRNGTSETVYQSTEVLNFLSRGVRTRGYAIAQPRYDISITTEE